MSEVTPKKSKKSKDHAGQSSSKKRRREEEQLQADDLAEKAGESPASRPKKKRRRSDKTEDEAKEDTQEASNDVALPDDDALTVTKPKKKEKKRKSDQIDDEAPEDIALPDNEAVTGGGRRKKKTTKKEKKQKGDIPPSTEEDPVDQSTVVESLEPADGQDDPQSPVAVAESVEEVTETPTIYALPTPEPDVHITHASATWLNKGQIEAHSPFVLETASLLLPLAPAAFHFPIQGLCAEHLSPLLLTYYPPLDGVVLSYARPRLGDSGDKDPPYLEEPDRSLETPPDHIVLARQQDEYNTPLVWLTADFLLLRPVKGTWLQGVVQIQNPSYLGLVCWNYFNAGVPKRRIPKGWRWVDEVRRKKVAKARTDGGTGDGDAMEGVEQEEELEEEEGVVVDGSEGFWVDDEGNKVQGLVEFRVLDFESLPATDRERGFVSITGSLLSDEEDKVLDREAHVERDTHKGKRKGKGKEVASG